MSKSKVQETKTSVGSVKETKEVLVKKLLNMEKKVERLTSPVINKHEMREGTFICKWCGMDHPAFDFPCVDRYEDGTLVKDAK